MESIAFWSSFWGWTLAIALGVFFVLAVSVTIGGFFDVKKLFRSIDDHHAQQADRD